MAVTVEKVMEQAKLLSPDERLYLAKRLLKSVELETDENVAALWEKEIKRRIAKLDAGEAEGRSWDKIRRDFELRYG